MDESLENIRKKLIKYNQEHLIYFYDNINENEKKILINQIEKIDFDFLQKLHINSYKEEKLDLSKVKPIHPYKKSKFDKEKIKEITYLGEDIIKQNKLAIITLAGGMGSRLGYKGPKGCYEIDVPPKKSLFEFICDKLKNAHLKYGVYLNWYIMTSPSNNDATIRYFEERKYFNYPKDKIFFFCQNTINILDINGKLLLDSEYSLKMDSNGNGDVFKAFTSSNVVNSISNIEWFSVSGIDNIILEIIDPFFIGLSIYNKSDIASKSVKKHDVYDKGWVFGCVDNKMEIIDPDLLGPEMLSTMQYNQINILSHLFNKSSFLKCSHIDIPYHRAFKKNDYINEEGMKIVATEPNSFKFEKFIFDTFKFFEKFTLLEVEEEKEFAPIKSFTGTDTPETALEKYLNKNNIK